VKHDELQEDLAAHLRGGTDRMVWTNTQLGPAGSPRPDLFTVNKSYSRFRTDCYEIKVSVSDLRSDVTSGKWQSYRKFGHAVWFAFPKGMAPLDLIPKECGVILRSDSGWRAARKPVAQVLDTLPRDAWLKLLIESSPGVLDCQPRTANAWTAAEVVRKKHGRQIADLFQDVHNMEDRLLYRKEKLQADLDEVEKQIQARRAELAEREKRSQERLGAQMQEVGVLLGLNAEEVTAESLAAAVSQFRRKLEGQGVLDAIRTLQTLQGCLPEPAAQRWAA